MVAISPFSSGGVGSWPALSHYATVVTRLKREFHQGLNPSRAKWPAGQIGPISPHFAHTSPASTDLEISCAISALGGGIQADSPISQEGRVTPVRHDR
ncbi:MAG: hypothetical protein AAGI70_13300 [Pseudomonadota bacterium]